MGRTCFQGGEFLKGNGGYTPSRFRWFGTSTGSGGGFIRYERECTLPVVLLPVPLPAGRGRAHSALADSQALCVSSDQNIASGVMQHQGGASVVLIAPSWPNQPWFPDLTELLIAPPWPIPVRRDMLSQVDGSVWHPNPELWNFMCGCFRVVRGARCIAVSCDRHTHGSASTLYKTFLCLKMGSVCEMVPSGSYRPGCLHRVGCSEFPAIQAG